MFVGLVCIFVCVESGGTFDIPCVDYCRGGQHVPPRFAIRDVPLPSSENLGASEFLPQSGGFRRRGPHGWFSVFPGRAHLRGVGNASPRMEFRPSPGMDLTAREVREFLARSNQVETCEVRAMLAYLDYAECKLFSSFAKLLRCVTFGL